MKKQDQVPTKEGKRTEKAAQPKARTRLIEIEVPMSGPLRQAVERGANKLSISPSQFVEQAIREKLPLVETALGKAQRPPQEGPISRATFDAKDRLEDATFRTAALLEALAALLELTENSDHPQLSAAAVGGLKFIALKEGAELRGNFENYTVLLSRERGMAIGGVQQ